MLEKIKIDCSDNPGATGVTLNGIPLKKNQLLRS